MSRAPRLRAVWGTVIIRSTNRSSPTSRWELDERLRQSTRETMNSMSRPIGYRERAAFYELEYTTTADHEFLLASTAPPVRSVLEIPCGVGRNALCLARPGLRLVAVDIEPEMIDGLRRRTLGEPRFSTLEAVVGDLRTLALGETFERIIVPREAFQLLTDLGDAHAALVHLRDHLDADGIMVVDLAHFRAGTDTEPGLQPDYFDPSLPEGEVLVEWEGYLPSGAHLTRSRQQFAPAVRRRLVRYHYDVRWPDGRHEDWTMDMPLLLYEYEDFLELAHRAGLEVTDVYRDYQRHPHGPGAARMIVMLRRRPSNRPLDADPSTLDTDVVGWVKDAAPGFDNQRHFRAIGDFSGVRLDPDRLRYFETYSRLYYYDRFIPGQGVEAILEQLARFGTRGHWLDLGAGTTTLLWSIPLTEVDSIDCCDIVVEALAVLARFAESEDVPPCYAEVLSAHGKTPEHLHAMRRKLRRFLVFDGLKPWPEPLAADRFDLITAFGVLSIAPDPEAYARALEELAAHLAPGGRAIGADWVRKATYIESDGHDNSYLDRSQAVSAARQAGLRPLECCRQPIVDDPHYDAVLCWTLEKPAG